MENKHRKRIEVFKQRIKRLDNLPCFGKMRSVLIAAMIFTVLQSCHYGDVEVSQGIESELDVSYSAFSKGKPVHSLDFSTGRNIYRPQYITWGSKDNFIWLLQEAQISGLDSLLFVSSKSERTLSFINPIVDDSVDFKAKLSAHFWNIDNWYATKDAVYYLLTTENFERFAKEI